MHLQSTYIPHLQHLSNWKHIWNPVKICRGAFLQYLRSLDCWLSLQKSSIVDVSLDSGFNFFQKLIITCRSSEEKLSTIGVMQGNLGFTLPRNSLNLHQTQKQKMETWTESFLILITSPKLCKCSQISHPSLRVDQPPIEQKSNHQWLNHLQILLTH